MAFRVFLSALFFMVVLPACDGDEEPAPVCSVPAGHCPNFCDGGEVEQGDTCTPTETCACGLVCSSGACVPGAGLLAPFGDKDAPCSCEEIVIDPGTPTGKEAGAACAETTECASGLDCVNFVCVTAPGSKAAGEDCTGDVECATDLICVNFVCVDAPPVDIDDCPKGAPSGADCNPYCDLGCEEDEHCSYSGSVQCVGFGETGMSESCGSSEFCEPGLACVGLNSDDLGGICRKWCIDDADCPSDRKCTVSVNFTGGFGGTFCSEAITACEPFSTENTCGDGQGCYFSSQSQATQCMAAGTQAEGEDCTDGSSNACLPGLQCFVLCTTVCSTGSNGPSCTDCESGEVDEIDPTTGMGLCLTPDPPASCDIFAQDCPSGEKCSKVTGGIACVTDGAVAVGGVCGGSNGGCVKGALCINSQCAQICDASEDASVTYACSEICKSQGNLSPAIWEIGFCTDEEPAEPCDFWEQDCADPAQSCYLVNNGATCLDPSGNAAEGAGCQYIADCAQGLYCASSECIVPCSLDAFSANSCENVCTSDYEIVNSTNGVGKCLDG